MITTINVNNCLDKLPKFKWNDPTLNSAEHHSLTIIFPDGGKDEMARLSATKNIPGSDLEKGSYDEFDNCFLHGYLQNEVDGNGDKISISFYQCSQNSKNFSV